ncbi:glycosyltransferase family 2 protein [uncultured Thiodictyon sp.]|uniref:glycosyltransferase family 2 protein n=1 Tax=uncultured Thiodictyon sp. TaxID=1846217 RepID=UPI0025D60DE0|nr:glycosyltransferase family 2 protein [uncultured Thiodictyon sp.]
MTSHTPSRTLISIVTPCFNEEDNVVELVARIEAALAPSQQYDYEHIFIDNASTDRTVERIKLIARANPRVKLIVNARNFGHIRSPVHGIMQAQGAAVIAMASDLQDPPELIDQFIRKWEAGYQVAIGVKPRSKDSWLMSIVRRGYYRSIGRISDVKLIPDFTGFGLYDRSVIEEIRKIDDPYPYFRGLISELGFEYATITFEQPRRTRGITKNNFYTLYDLAMLGITSHSKVPVRLATMAGFVLALISLGVSIAYLVLKLLFWNYFTVGTAPILISIFFFAAVQLFFIGIIGEYVASIHTQVMRRPLVVEKERVNFHAE